MHLIEINSLWPHLPTKLFLEYLKYDNKHPHLVLTKLFLTYYVFSLLICWLTLSSLLTW